MAANNSLVERYAEEFRAIEKDSRLDIPDRVTKLTHDVNGNRLPCEYVQLNQRLVFHLNKIPKFPEHKFDYLAYCVGYSGVGKSHLLQRIALYLNHEFSLSDISFNIHQLNEWITNAKPGSIGIFDEADILSAGYYDQVLKQLISQAKRMRTKRLILFLAAPTMRDIAPYWAHRFRMVLYCFVPKKGAIDNRGWVHCFHDQDMIADLYSRLKKAYSENSLVYASAYSTLRNNYQGRSIPDDWPIDDEAYEAKKELARQQVERDQGLTVDQRLAKQRREITVRLRAFSDMIQDKFGIKITHKELMSVMGVKKTTFYDDLEEGLVDV